MSKRTVVLYAAHARKDLLELEKDVARKIALKIQENAEFPNPLMRAKALQGSLSGMYRYRVGDYRVIFEIDSAGNISILTILRVKHRKDIYRTYAKCENMAINRDFMSGFYGLNAGIEVIFA